MTKLTNITVLCIVLICFNFSCASSNQDASQANPDHSISVSGSGIIGELVWSGEGEFRSFFLRVSDGPELTGAPIQYRHREFSYPFLDGEVNVSGWVNSGSELEAETGVEVRLTSSFDTVEYQTEDDVLAMIAGNYIQESRIGYSDEFGLIVVFINGNEQTGYDIHFTSQVLLVDGKSISDSLKSAIQQEVDLIISSS